MQVPGLKTATVNKRGQILARVQVNDKFHIQLLDRFGREVISDIHSECTHLTHLECLIAHPTDADYVLESCNMCEVIRNYNIWSGECKIVYRDDGLILRMCHGPNDSILVDQILHLCIFELKWEKELQELRNKGCVCRSRYLTQLNPPTVTKSFEVFCCVEEFNMLVIINMNEEIEAMRLRSESPIWKLSEVVSGHLIKPDAMTADAEGNVYISDGANNTILKINGLTGDIMHIVLLEEENKDPKRCLFWSDTELNLTTMHGDRITNYNISKLF